MPSLLRGSQLQVIWYNWRSCQSAFKQGLWVVSNVSKLYFIFCLAYLAIWDISRLMQGPLWPFSLAGIRYTLWSDWSCTLVELISSLPVGTPCFRSRNRNIFSVLNSYNTNTRSSVVPISLNLWLWRFMCILPSNIPFKVISLHQKPFSTNVKLQVWIICRFCVFINVLPINRFQDIVKIQVFEFI